MQYAQHLATIEAFKEKKKKHKWSGIYLSGNCPKLSWFLAQGSVVVPKSKVAGRKIVYCSRTHTQIKQIVRELKKTEYRPKMIAMGSREQMCTNREVKKASSYAQRTMCRSLGMHCSFYRNACFHVNTNIYENDALPDKGLMDIEDLVAYGNRHNVVAAMCLHCRCAPTSCPVMT